MICLHCQHLDLRSFPEHARVGAGRCKLEALPGVFVTITRDRDCRQFEQAPTDVVEKREQWRKK